MSSINLDLGAPADTDFASTLFVTPGLAQEMGGALDLTKVQEVATKLDLAKAYEEMGDAEGARELLQEVMSEGSAEQKQAAGAILKRLG
jgi:pilus assembly protein FimV